MDTVVFCQQLKHLMLGVIRTPTSHPLGQSWGGQTRFDPQAQLQRMDGASAPLKRLVEAPPYLYGSKQRCHRVGVLAATPIEMPLKLNPSMGFLVVFRLQVMSGVGLTSI